MASNPATTSVDSVPAGVSGWFAGQVANLGGLAMATVAGVGDVTLFAFKTLGWILARRQRRDVLLPNFYQIGVMSLPVVALTGLFIGMVLAVQSYAQFKALGLETRLGSVINLSLVRELGPVLAATMLAGRVGSAMAAELGTMRVTEQIDALECMGANPIHHLVVPRFLGCLVLIPALTDGRFHGRAGRLSLLPPPARHRLPPLLGELDRKSTRLNSSHTSVSRMPSSA